MREREAVDIITAQAWSRAYDHYALYTRLNKVFVEGKDRWQLCYPMRIIVYKQMAAGKVHLKTDSKILYVR